MKYNAVFLLTIYTGLLVGCSHAPQTPELVFPVGFTGVAEIRKADNTGYGPTPDRGQLVVDIPDDGVRWVDPEVYVTYFTQQQKVYGLLPRFDDGQALPFFNPALPFNANQPDAPMLLGLAQTGGNVYIVIDNYTNLSRFYQRFWEDIRRDGEAAWQRYFDDLNAAYAQVVADVS